MRRIVRCTAEGVESKGVRWLVLRQSARKMLAEGKWREPLAKCGVETRRAARKAELCSSSLRSTAENSSGLQVFVEASVFPPLLSDMEAIS